MISRCGRVLGLLALAGIARAQEAQPQAAPQPPPAVEVQPPAPPSRPAVELNDGLAVVPVDRVRKPAPLFFSAAARGTATPALDKIQQTIEVTLTVHQGTPERLTLGLSEAGEVLNVTGEGLRDWAVRRNGEGRRFLDLRPASPAEGGRRELAITITAASEVPAGGLCGLLLLDPGEAVGFTQVVTLAEAPAGAPGVDWRVEKVEGLLPLDGGKAFTGSGEEAELVLRLNASGAHPGKVELAGLALEGRTAPGARAVSFVLTGKLEVAEAGAAVRLLSGRAALSGATSGDGWHVRLTPEGDEWAYEVVGERPGSFALSIPFEAPLRRKDDWRMVDFRVPAGVIVPVVLDGLGAQVSFDRGQAVVPEAAAGKLRGFLPVTGSAAMAWKPAREEAEGALFFSGFETGELRVGAGLLRQSSKFALRVLQGRLAAVNFLLDGPGEVLEVRGPQVLGWAVREADGKRRLEVRLSQPIEGTGEIEVAAQSALGAFPVTAVPLRMVPEGALRHSGVLRIANEGAVRVEVAGVSGMMQLAPAQFPGDELQGARQVFVYRFPAAEYGFQLAADQVLPEVAVNQVLVHELSETDRILHADVELDIREAPLREWEMTVPGEYAVAAVSGETVADFAPGSEVKEGARTLKVIFREAVAGRQLLAVRLERNIEAAAGEWKLERLGFPGAKSVRGHLGVASTPGYRVTPAGADGLAELATAYFPKQFAGLQQAFRIKQAGWSATMAVEALGQSVHADVFHLYSLQEGVVFGSVLVNYFVVGAPAGEWRIELPEGIGNVEVTGQQVRRDWRREAAVLVVPLAKPVLGPATVLLTFEQPMSARGGELQPGLVRPLGVQSERGHIHVVSPLQVNYEVSRSEGALLRLDPLELPAEYRLLTAHPTLGAWQYTARPFELATKVEWFARGETVPQVVDFVNLASRVSRDGQVLTDVLYLVKARGQSLRVTLPEKAKLLEARVKGEVVNAQLAGAETLVPLPASLDPNNEPVQVKLRYGTLADRATRPRLAAPAVAAPTVISEWKVKADTGRRLVPAGGNAELVGEPLTETGFEWVSSRPVVCGVFALILLAVLLGRKEPGLWRGLVAVAAGLGGLIGAIAVVVPALQQRRPSVAELDYTAPVVQAGHSVMIEVRNVEAWRALVSVPGILLVVLGLGLLAWPLVRREGPWWRAPLGVAVLGIGVLAQRGGAVWFFLLVAATWLLCGLVPLVVRWVRGIRARRAAKVAPATGGGAAAAVLAALVWWGGGAGEPAAAALPPGTKPAESMIHSWQIAGGRLRGEIDVRARGAAGDRFLLLRAPAVLTKFEGDGWRVVKGRDGDAEAYFLVAAAEGLHAGRATFDMPLPDPRAGWAVPGGPAAVQQIDVRWDQAGWEFDSPLAARVAPLEGLAEGSSGARLVLGPAQGATLVARPRQRDVAGEETRFFVEVSNLFVPGPGVVNGRHKVTVRPAQGRVAGLVLVVPEGFTVGDVGEGPVGSWRFDPRSRELRLAVEPAQEAAFSLTVQTQRGTGALPVELVLAPLHVQGDSGEVGLCALAFGGDAQPENVKAEAMPVVNLDDFDAALLPVDREKRPLAVLQRVFRYQGDDGSLALRVVPVEPEVRLASKQVLSLGDDRLVLAADLTTEITRAGVFRLTMDVPAELEVESLTGGALGHWTEAAAADGRKRLTLHLNGRTLGAQQFALTLVGQAPGTQEAWPVPRLGLLEAARHTGTLTVVPGRGLQVRPVARRSVSQLDAREAGSAQPGALGFRILQADWEVKLATSELEPWVTARVLHDVTLREGQVLTRATIDYKVENAAVKRLRVRLPGLDEQVAATVRASGPALADCVRVEGPEAAAGDVWELVFQRGIAGTTSVDIEFQRQRDGDGTGGREELRPIELQQVRQTTYFVAVRPAGRLQVTPAAVPRGWQAVDWSVAKATLGEAGGRGEPGVPSLVLRVSEPEGPLVLGLARHELAGGVRLRVSSGELVSLLAPDGAALTNVALEMEVGEKGTLRLRPPAGGQVFNVLVNGESAPLVCDKDGWWLCHVFPNPEAGRPASVRFTYGTPPARRVRLEGPAINVPLENLRWQVIVPEGWRIDDHRGDFELEEVRAAGRYRLDDYLSSVASKRQREAQEAVQMLEKGNQLRQAGDQFNAGLAFSKAAKARALDEASNEDARVQLQQLRCEQAVVGLNTRRQKFYFDNRFNDGAGPRNDQLEQAANANPVLQQGALNWDPQQVDQLLLGNSAEENTALKAIANRIVAQQLAAEPAPVALDVTLPQRGRVATFGRALQVSGEQALELDLDLARERRAGPAVGLLLVLLAAVPALLRRK